MSDTAWTARPLLPLRDIVLFPGMVVPLFVGRPASIAAVDEARSDAGSLCAVTQRRAEDDAPGCGDLFTVGVLAEVRERLDLPDGTLKILIAPTRRAVLGDIRLAAGHLAVDCRPMDDSAADPSSISALARATVEAFMAAIEARQLTDAAALADFVGPLLGNSVLVKQRVLEAPAIDERLRLCLAAMDGAMGRPPAGPGRDLE